MELPIKFIKTSLKPLLIFLIFSSCLAGFLADAFVELIVELNLVSLFVYFISWVFYMVYKIHYKETAVAATVYWSYQLLFSVAWLLCKGQSDFVNFMLLPFNPSYGFIYFVDGRATVIFISTVLAGLFLGVAIWCVVRGRKFRKII